MSRPPSGKGLNGPFLQFGRTPSCLCRSYLTPNHPEESVQVALSVESAGLPVASRYILLYLVLNHTVRCDELLQGPLNFWALARASQHLEDVCGVYEKYEKLFLFFFFF